MNDLDTPTRPAPSVNGEMLNRVQQLRLDGQLGAAKSARGGGAAWLPWILCTALALTWAGAALRTYRNPGGDSNLNLSAAPVTGKAGADTSSGAAPVEAGTVQLEVKGYLVPAVQVAVSPIDAAGQLIELNIKEGEYYAAGTPLAKIDPRNYQYSVDEAVEAVRAGAERLRAAVMRREELDPKSVRQIEKDLLKAQVNEARTTRNRAEDELRRLDSIRGNISGKEIDQAQNDALAAKFRMEKLEIDLKILEEGPRQARIAAADADVAVARAEGKSAEARLAQATWRLQNCVIRAPISGTVLTKKSERGNLVNPLAFAGGSGSVCDIADLSDLEVDLEIPERDIAKLKLGQACRVRADAFPGRTYAGRLDRIMPIANRAKSIVNVRVKVTLPKDEKPGTYLKPEMGAVASFLADEPK